MTAKYNVKPYIKDYISYQRYGATFLGPRYNIARNKLAGKVAKQSSKNDTVDTDYTPTAYRIKGSAREELNIYLPGAPVTRSEGKTITNVPGHRKGRAERKRA